MLEKSRFGKDGQQSEALQEPVRCFSTRVSNIPQVQNLSIIRRENLPAFTTNLFQIEFFFSFG